MNLYKSGDLKVGDWLQSRVSLGDFSYFHHFIYIGNMEIIGKNSEKDNEIKKVSLKTEPFAKLVKRGGVKTAKIAEKKLGKSPYSLYSANCENFCRDCYKEANKKSGSPIGQTDIFKYILGTIAGSIALNMASGRGTSFRPVIRNTNEFGMGFSHTFRF